jgi:ATP-binding cassette subfamily F protein uup
VLVLDEPTNDLDLETLDVLEEMLGDYAGTLILISHDRDFLDRIVNAVIVPEGDGRWTEYAGGYTDMLAQRGRGFALPEQAARPRNEKATPPASAPTEVRAKQRMSFRDKHALETLPARMQVLQADIATMQQRLDDPGLYARDRKAFEQTSTALNVAQGELASAEDRWLQLEMLREEIER